MVLERFVRSARKVEIEPNDSSIVAPHDDVITRWVHVHAADPLATTHEAFHQLLRSEEQTEPIRARQ